MIVIVNKKRVSVPPTVTTVRGAVERCALSQALYGHIQMFEYKLLNYLIQGSAADCTKQAIINYDSVKKHGRLLCTVHDEINLSVPKKAVKSEMKLLKEAMEAVEFDVPMISDCKVGPNWAAITKFEE